MIQLSQPALALHANDLGNIPKGYRTHLYQMKITWLMSRGASPSDVVYWILKALDQTPANRLNHVVINCHGEPGVLQVGGQYHPVHLDVGSVGLFGQLRNKEIGTIWLTGCNVASGAMGEWFCSDMAKKAGCDVVAANERQFVEQKFYSAGAPFGAIDEFEGTAYRFSPSGKKELFSIHDVEAERGRYYTSHDGKVKPN